MASDSATISTTDLARSTATLQWEEFNAQRLVSISVRMIDDQQRLDAIGTTLSTAGIRALRLMTGPHVIERSSDLIRSHPADGVLVCMIIRGQACVVRDGRTSVLDAGQLAIVEPDRPFLGAFSSQSEAIAIMVTRRLFAEATAMLNVRIPAVMRVDGNSYARALRDHVVSATRLDNPAPIGDRFVLAMISGMLGGERPPIGDYLAGAQQYIGANLSDSTLSAPRIAGAIGISERHLSRVFAEAGTSVPQYLRARRLEQAITWLRRAEPGTTVSNIARECGFASTSHFSRSFSARFGVHASDLLRQSIAANVRASAN